jgi:hypothetical protein
LSAPTAAAAPAAVAATTTAATAAAAAAAAAAAILGNGHEEVGILFHDEIKLLAFGFKFCA